MRDAPCMLSLSAHQHSHVAAPSSRCSLQVLLYKGELLVDAIASFSAYTGNSSKLLISLKVCTLMGDRS
jgi:hypothetical protein